MIIAIYCRKSVYRDTSDSIGNQVDMCRDFILRNFGEDHTILVYDKDEGISGATTERPCFQKMMEDVKNGIINMVVCYMIDRLSRNIKDFCNIYFTLQEHDCRFVSVKENIDDTTPMGRAMLYICQVFANLERDNIRERIIDNMGHIEQLGYWAGGLAPFGYQIDKVTVNGKKHSILKIDETESKIFLKMADMFLNQHASLYTIEDELLREGYTTASGAILDTSRIWKYLSNPVYMCADETAYDYFHALGCQMLHEREMFDGNYGIMVRGRFGKSGKSMQQKEKTEWKIYVGKHEPLLSSEDWIEIQKNFRKNPYHKQQRKSFGLCNGFIRCKCGYAMRTKSQTYRPTGHTSTSYICTRRENKGRGSCDSHMISADLVDAAVMEQLKLISIDLDTLKECRNKNKPAEVPDRKALLGKLKSLDEKITALTTSLIDAQNSTARKYIIQEIEKLDEQKTKINSALTECNIIQLRSRKEEKDTEELYHQIHKILAVFDTLDLPQKNQMLRSVIKEVRVVDGKVEIDI